MSTEILSNAPYLAAETAEWYTGFPVTKAVGVAGAVVTVGKGLYDLYDSYAPESVSKKSRGNDLKKDNTRGILGLNEVSFHVGKRRRNYWFETIGKYRIKFSNNYINH